MIEAQLLVPDAGYDDFRDLWVDRAAIYARVLARHGVALRSARWTEADPRMPALACLVWGYHLRVSDWLEFLAGWPVSTPLINPASLLSWNTDKRYLIDLETAGVPIVPTRFALQADAGALAQARDAFGKQELVVKPRVSGAGYRTTRCRPGELAPDLDDAMIQPFLSAVATEGELSIYFFGGVYSHTVRKVAAPTEFRVQREYGGQFTAMIPDVQTLTAAGKALAAVPDTAAYARVDLIRMDDGRLAVMELELIEPDLYLDLVPEAEDRFGAAISKALEG